MKALVLCNGDPPSTRLLQRLARQADLLVAADGGANYARTRGLYPDIIIGDLDSLRSSTRRAFSKSRVIHVRRQDNTDLEKALDYLVEHNVPRAVVAGVTGGRVDFTLGNFSVLWKYAGELDITFVGDGWYAVPVGRVRHVETTRGTTVSLIPVGTCSGVTLKGLVYPLRNATLGPGQTAVSNKARASRFTVEVKKGNLLLLVLENL